MKPCATIICTFLVEARVLQGVCHALPQHLLHIIQTCSSISDVKQSSSNGEVNATSDHIVSDPDVLRGDDVARQSLLVLVGRQVADLVLRASRDAA